MKTKYFIILAFILSAFPLMASAQDNASGLYVVGEAGTVQNSMTLSGDLAGLANENNSGGSFGFALGYRALLSNNIIVGIEGNVASSSANSNVTDGFDTITFDENYLAGVYLTAGIALGNDNRTLLYGLLGVASVGADTSVAGVFTGSETIDDKGDGISFGGAFEYGFTDSLGVRIKALHTRYKGDLDELKIRDTSFMAGLVYSF